MLRSAYPAAAVQGPITALAAPLGRAEALRTSHLAPCTLPPPSSLPPGKIKQATIKKSKFSLHALNKAPHNDFCMPSLAVLLASRLRATEYCRVPEKRQGGVENADER